MPPTNMPEVTAVPTSFNPSKEMTAVPPGVTMDLNNGVLCFNPSKEMTAVPPLALKVDKGLMIVFQPLKGNDGRAATMFVLLVAMLVACFNPSKEMTAVPPRSHRRADYRA